MVIVNFLEVTLGQVVLAVALAVGLFWKAMV